MKRNIEKNKYYKTSDISLASVLSLSVPIETIDRSNPKKVLFVFNKSYNLLKLVEKYWRGELRIDPKVFSQTQKEIKTRIFIENQTEEN